VVSILLRTQNVPGSKKAVILTENLKSHTGETSKKNGKTLRSVRLVRVFKHNKYKSVVDKGNSRTRSAVNSHKFYRCNSTALFLDVVGVE
jgi:hypothetical protein